MKLKIRVTIFYIITTTVLVIALASCKKLVEVEPPIDKETSITVYKTTSSAASVLMGIYYRLASTAGGGFANGGPDGMSVLMGLSSDEFSLYDEVNDNRQLLFFKNEVTANGPFWNDIYDCIYRTNSLIEGVEVAEEISERDKHQLIGQSKFLRAYSYFYLVNLYGDVPLALTADYKVTSKLNRSPVSEVYNQIIIDLLYAKEFLDASYLASDLIKPTGERICANKSVASALLARVYLYTQQWQKAEDESSLLINDKNFDISIPLDNVFLKNSKETILQLQTLNNMNTDDGEYFIPSIENPQLFISENAMKEFEEGDERKTSWIGYLSQDELGNNITIKPYPYKYKFKGNSGSVNTL